MPLFTLQVSLFRTEKRTKAAAHRTIVSHNIEQDVLRRANLGKDDFIEGTCKSFIFVEVRGRVTLALTDGPNTVEYVLDKGIFTLPANATFKISRIEEGPAVAVTLAHD